MCELTTLESDIIFGSFFQSKSREYEEEERGTNWKVGGDAGEGFLFDGDKKKKSGKEDHLFLKEKREEGPCLGW